MAKKGFGPGMMPAESTAYRIEYAVLTLVILGLLMWRGFLTDSFGLFEIVLTFFLALMPDVVFLVMAPYMKKGKWPSWGSDVYNVFHSWVPWFVVAGSMYAITGDLFWPLLGWALHLSLDRTTGYYLRAKK